ncbi:MAG: ABC transporter permease subunit [Planctomycetes bacterium]|nr:ABC transporter permease subunit [Planctomycetota bacterium]
MTWALTRKLLRDIRIAWVVVAVLLFLFQILWARITMRVTTQIFAALGQFGVTRQAVMRILFNQGEPGQSPEMLGQMVQAIIGGENIAIDKAGDLMSVSYVHPLVLSILCIWAIGRAANAIAGEIDRGTMELLLAQPIRRTQVVLAHLLVDAIVFPTICAVMWFGTYCGTWWMGLQAAEGNQHVDPWRFVPALLCVSMLLLSVSGVTMAISALGRSRARVWGWAVTLFLGMFLVNVFGQIWPEALDWLRPFTLHYHYQPQNLIKADRWYASGAVWFHLVVLALYGFGGYLTAWITFCRRDRPAPL